MKKFLKIFGLIFLGYVIAIITYSSGYKIIGTELSPNGKYKLIYRATPYGGIFFSYYRHYVEVKEVSSNKSLLLHFVKSDDIKSPENEAHWVGDTIVVTGNDFYSSDNKLQKIEVTDEKTVFYFPEGYATK